METILKVIVQVALLAMPLLRSLASRAPDKTLVIIKAIRPIIDEAQKIADDELVRRAANK